ncbi:MAG: helix-turn-helix domain-containing protein [Bdellovibrionaceae bacterium]|nr:helix-turn-helix domain-containing protein [Pseudobdellovibrionaceae bacterium]
MRRRSSQILHPIESLGVKKVSRGEIRVEKLSDRLEPKVAFPHRHDFFQITVVTKGLGWHEIDFKKHKVAGKKLFFMKPGQVHTWKFNKKSVGFVLEFTTDSLSRSIETSAHRLPIATFADSIAIKGLSVWNEIESICQIMEHEFNRKSKNYEVALEGLLVCLLAGLSRSNENVAVAKANSIVERFQTLVNEKYKKEHTVQFYAHSLNVTSKALTMKIGRALGKSAMDVIQSRILLEAKRLLSYSDASVAETGYILGFEDANYFTRFFKKQMGLSPTQFRERIQATVVVKKD